MLTLKDDQSQPSLKYLQMYFHTTLKWMDTTGCTVGMENTNVISLKRSLYISVVIGVKDAKTLAAVH